MLKSIAALSTLIRSVVALAATVMLSVGGWVFYRSYNSHELALQEKDRELKVRAERIDELSKDVETKKKEIERLLMVVRLLKIDHRVAHLTVLDQQPTEDGKNVVSTVRFVEVDNEGHPIGEPHEFAVQGNVVYVDALVIKFADEYVEQADPLKGTSACLFRRIFGESQKPEEGFPIDAVGSRPAAYSPGSEMSDFERDLWDRFWEYANDRAKAEAAGIRAIHGEAPYMKVQKGKTYRVELRASGGLTFKAED